MRDTLIRGATLVNEGKSFIADVRIKDGCIDAIALFIPPKQNDQIIEADGLYLLPGMIDDQVHFREPGLIHKGRIASESQAAVAGGITSYMEMPNVNPSTTTNRALQQKINIAASSSLANYSFYLGATEDNLEQIKLVNPRTVCGIKVFMGASTGDLLVENPTALENIFAHSPVPVVTHCEDSRVIAENRRNLKHDATIFDHPIIRDNEACYASSSYAVDLAKRHGTQLHVLHLTTEKELSLFSTGDITAKSITAEVCVHHLWFSSQDYQKLGNLIKCNPAVKQESDRQALIRAVNSGKIDIIATDHAPHTWQEKQVDYSASPAGMPLVQHALLSLLEHVKHGNFSIELVVQKASHNPALRFGIEKRGFLREGYYADLVLVDPNGRTNVDQEELYYHCQWTPFTGTLFSSRIVSTWVNGTLVFDGSLIHDHSIPSQPLLFQR